MKRDPSLPPQIVAVGFRRINKMLQDLAPAFHTQAHIEVVDVGFANAVAQRLHGAVYPGQQQQRQQQAYRLQPVVSGC